jgi:hypothetical protein
MTNENEITDRIRKFSSEDEMLVPLVNIRIEGILDSGGRFFGDLEGFSEFLLFIKGERGQRIIIKRRKVAWMEAV